MGGPWAGREKKIAKWEQERETTTADTSEAVQKIKKSA